MRILLIEDEPPGMEQLRNYLQSSPEPVQVVAEIDSVAAGRARIPQLQGIDLVFSDIQLSDGLAFDILQLLPPATPIVFVTAYDDYLLKAFDFHSVDYLLKPLRKEKLLAAVAKFVEQRGRYSTNLQALLNTLTLAQPEQRFLVKKGTAFYPVNASDVAYFFTEHKMVFLVDREGTKYVYDQSLIELEATMPPDLWFRANRNFLVAMHAVERFRPYGKSKLELELRPAANAQVLVSQEKAAAFKAWLGG